MTSRWARTLTKLERAEERVNLTFARSWSKRPASQGRVGVMSRRGPGKCRKLTASEAKYRWRRRVLDCDALAVHASDRAIRWSRSLPCGGSSRGPEDDDRLRSIGATLRSGRVVALERPQGTRPRDPNPAADRTGQ